MGGGAFWCLSLLLVVAFLAGGSSRADVPALIVLRPVAILCLGYGLSRLTADQVRAHRVLLGLALATVILAIAHIVPLPPELWTRLPGREIVVEIDRVAGLGAVWRPLSLSPSGSLNALFSLAVPLAVLVLGVQLTRDERWLLLPLIIIIGLASGILGVLQLGGPADGALYPYRVTNAGSAVGLFANRNHQAVLLAILLPMLAVWASTRLRSPTDARVRSFAVVAACTFLVPLTLVTGSRAGLFATLLGLMAAVLLYRPPLAREISPSPPRRWRMFLAAAGAVVVGVSLITITLGRAQAYERLIGRLAADEPRFKIWGPVMEMAGKYIPWGSGNGSFVEVYQLDESRELLSAIYFNHAHNDWLELLFTGGLPAYLLLGVAIVVMLRVAARLARVAAYNMRDRLMAWTGITIILLFGVASVGDYPLRVPSLASLLAIAAIWISSCKPVSGEQEAL